MPERKAQRPDAAREVVAAVHADRASGVRERRDLGERLGRHRLAGDEKVDRLDPGRLRGLDEVLALDDEEPLTVALRTRGQPPHEPQPRVRGRGDQDESPFRSEASSPGCAGWCEARTQGALVSAVIRARLRTPHRAAQRGPAA
jgi:hypothetical protein